MVKSTVLCHTEILQHHGHVLCGCEEGQWWISLHQPREVLMGVGDGVASVIMLTFTKRPSPHADFYKEARPPC